MGAVATKGLIEALREELRLAADPARAPKMQAYMKSEVPFLGVPAPVQAQVYRAVLPRYRLASFDEWRDTVARLWRDATHREERYAAIALAEDRRYRRFRTLEALPLFEEMIVTGGWWDFVDRIATRLVRGLLVAYPEPMRATLLKWSSADDLWKRRASIICQNGLRERTDLHLLYACIEPSLGEREFFLRKAIGWALREYSKTDPDQVRRYVRENEHRLSPLAAREALKWIRATFEMI